MVDKQIKNEFWIFRSITALFVQYGFKKIDGFF